MTQDPKSKLRELVAMLAGYCRELELAERQGNETFAAIERRLVSAQRILIREHCARWGLPGPMEAPEDE